ncbi:MAG: hypothetical protein ACK4UJ_05945 [Leptonema sp. (in: bacteria)]
MILSKHFWNEEVYNALIHAIEDPTLHKQEKTAVFDFDNTLILGDQGLNLMYDLILNQKIHAEQSWFWDEKNWQGISEEEKDKAYFLYQLSVKNPSVDLGIQLLDQFLIVFEYLEKKNLEMAYRWTKIFYAGFTVEELKQYSEESFKSALKKDFKFIDLPSGRQIQQGIRINQAFYELIQILTERDWDIYIITASPEVAIQAISKYWNLSESQIIGMKLKLENQILLPQIEEPYTYDQGKYLAFKNIVKKPIYIAGGDSYPDIYLLENSKLPIFLNHSFKEPLLKIAKEKKFYIQNLQ